MAEALKEVSVDDAAAAADDDDDDDDAVKLESAYLLARVGL